MKFGGTGGRPWSGLEGLYGIPPGQDGLGRTVGMAPGYLRGIPVVPPNVIIVEQVPGGWGGENPWPPMAS